MGAGGGGEGGTLCPRLIFLFLVGASGILRKPLTKSKKPMVKRVKVEIVNYTIFISTSKFELQIQFRPTTKLCIRRCIGAISFTLANSNIWSVKKLQAIINLSSWKFVETQLFAKCKTDVFLKKTKKQKNRQDFTDKVLHLYVSFELLVSVPFLSFS